MRSGEKPRPRFEKDDLFGARDFARRKRFRKDYRILATGLLRLLDFESIIDVGCATGLLLRELADAGKTVGGIELSPEVVKYLPTELMDKVQVGDFSDVRGRADLVSCIEMAEHIDSGRSEELVHTLTGISTRWVYFTAAQPGQRGKGHINCRPMEDWVSWFNECGWDLDRDRTENLRVVLGQLKKAVWLRGNSMIFGIGSASGRG